MDSLLKWIDSSRFDELLIRGVRVLLIFTAAVSLPYILWNVVRWLLF